MGSFLHWFLLFWTTLDTPLVLAFPFNQRNGKLHASEKEWSTAFSQQLINVLWKARSFLWCEQNCCLKTGMSAIKMCWSLFLLLMGTKFLSGNWHVSPLWRSFPSVGENKSENWHVSPKKCAGLYSFCWWEQIAVWKLAGISMTMTIVGPENLQVTVYAPTFPVSSEQGRDTVASRRLCFRSGGRWWLSWVIGVMQFSVVTDMKRVSASLLWSRVNLRC